MVRERREMSIDIRLLPFLVYPGLSDFQLLPWPCCRFILSQISWGIVSAYLSIRLSNTHIKNPRLLQARGYVYLPSTVLTPIHFYEVKTPAAIFMRLRGTGTKASEFVNLYHLSHNQLSASKFQSYLHFSFHCASTRWRTSETSPEIDGQSRLRSAPHVLEVSDWGK